MSLATAGEDAIIVRSTVDLAHSLGLTVLAEGVEDPDGLQALVEFGCDLAQGYHLGRPVAPEDLAETLSAVRVAPAPTLADT
jgi:EAL domain-containing protein (putative c-di-GMP-specific phosphodiesterase class I)